MGADSVVKLLHCYPQLELHDLDVVDYLIEQMNTKLATGEAYSELNSEDFVRLSASLKANPNSPLAPQVMQRLQDYVTASMSQFSIDDRNFILRNISHAKLKSNTSVPGKNTPEEVRSALRFGLGVKETKEIDLTYSPVEGCYSLYFPATKTRL